MQNNSKGCCIFAYNTETIDYFSQAEEAADRVSHFLDLPVTIFTNTSKKSKHNVILTELPNINLKQSKVWYNRNRNQVFELSPYEKTLVIDSDYFLCSDTLKFHLESSAPFLITKDFYHLKTGNFIPLYLGRTHIPLLWATVMIFDKSQESQSIFSMAKLIEENYLYYSLLYKFHPHPIRNDFIFSIACHLIGGYGRKSFALKNYPIVNCEQDIYYEKFEDNKLIYKYEHLKIYGNRIKNMDLHLMNKDQL